MMNHRVSLIRNEILSTVCAIAVALLCGSPAVAADRPHVVLVSIDTLRADALHSYGFEHEVRYSDVPPEY